ncbi:MAG TPA: alpha/beta hydrolase [Terriglobales bacterium]|nr:alpha/beta hydrolase [Terriglobales bacterium]
MNDGPPSRRGSWLRRTVIVLAILYAAGTLFGGMWLGEVATHPGRRPLTPTDENQVRLYAVENKIDIRDASTTAQDGAVLRGWLFRPAQANGSTVILLHGVSDNRLGMFGYGRWLLVNHYSVLLPDARAHGLSGGSIATYGLLESDDIHRWAYWIRETERPSCIFGFGESMGAAQILQALSREPGFCAVVAESPFETFREVSYARFGQPFHLGPWLGRTFFWPTDEVGFLYVRMKYGLNLDSASPKEAVRASRVPVLLIHGTSDNNIPSYNSKDIQAANPLHASLWLVPGAGHCGAYDVNPQEFGSKILSWFSEHSAVHDKAKML